MNLIPIGNLQKPHGTKGELRVNVEEAHWDDFQRAAVFFVEQQGQNLPYFKARVRTENPVTILFEDVTSREAAKRLSNCKLLLQQQDISTNLNETLGYSGYTGFVLLDKELGEIGVIEEVLALPQQKMAMTIYKGKDVMIPLNDTFITKVDTARKQIILDLPEGLLEL